MGKTQLDKTYTFKINIKCNSFDATIFQSYDFYWAGLLLTAVRYHELFDSYRSVIAFGVYIWCLALLNSSKNTQNIAIFLRCFLFYPQEWPCDIMLLFGKMLWVLFLFMGF